MKNSKPKLSLNEFLPYRLTKLSGIISRTLAERYSEQFDLTIHEWRVVAIIGEQPGLTARQVSDLASLDKVSISRAIERLEKSGRIQRKVTPKDRRAYALHLTDKGHDVLERIIPLAQDFERNLLSSLDQQDLAKLLEILAKLDQQADQLSKDKLILSD
ncbi:MarR family winged helix-turn-helix transcriptional regulator [Sneathiella glossodoripedis]|uniref:MarR family winged helix-turn-helix transcriptional regulator n=1 Tax=Sneathiella glossodoripedis TaxID=418853 RepID=UPI000472CCC5|nr:MarR family transcriptional regulator [Sneathiella glossodoripedis]